jgi:hypothetical protein
MIGHPSETIEDVEAIAQLCKAVLAEGRSIIGRKAKVNAGVSTFIPKPHTPFQWSSCDTFDQIEAKQYLLRRSLKGQGLKLNWNDPRGIIVLKLISISTRIGRDNLMRPFPGITSTLVYGNKSFWMT